MLLFDKNKLRLPKDHIAYQLLEDLPKRFENLKAFKKWYLRGPSVTDGQYHFVLCCEDMGIQDIYTIPEAEMLFEPKKVERFFGQVVEKVLMVEMSDKFVNRLHGQTAEEVHEEPEDTHKIYVCED